ncbi:hypothetical protein Tco_1468239 [Tanacetum coccineum]
MQDGGRSIGVLSCFKMKSYIDKLERLAHLLPHVITVNTVLGSLPKLFDNFTMNNKMRAWDNKSIEELHSMLKTAEKNVSYKSVVSSLHMIREGRVNNKSWKKGKGRSKAKARQADKLGMRSRKRLEKGVMVLHMGSGNQTKVDVIGTYFLNVPSGMKICLEQCHYTPTITIGVIFVSHLRDAGYELPFKHYGISVSKNNMLYFNAFPRNGIFEINLDDMILIDKFVFHVAKQTKYDLNTTYLWHCRVSHIKKKHIKKLLSDGILESIGSDSFECASNVYVDDKEPFLWRNCTLLDMVRSMMNLSDVPLSFCGYALETVARILNIVPTKKGCDVLIERATPNKIEARTIKFLGIRLHASRIQWERRDT